MSVQSVPGQACQFRGAAVVPAVPSFAELVGNMKGLRNTLVDAIVVPGKCRNPSPFLRKASATIQSSVSFFSSQAEGNSPCRSESVLPLRSAFAGRRPSDGGPPEATFIASSRRRG